MDGKNYAVNLLTHDDGEAHPDAGLWHIIDPTNKQGAATLCSGEFFGYGESGCKYELRVLTPGTVTCQRCIDDIQTLKKLKI